MLLKECDAYPFMSTAKVSRQAQPPLARFKLEACTKADIFVSQPTLDLHQYIYIYIHIQIHLYLNRYLLCCPVSDTIHGCV